jgi:hypothetical protein
MDAAAAERPSSRTGRTVIVLVVVACTLLAVAANASAGVGDAVFSPCDDPVSQPFLPWLDSASYALVPNGGLESAASGWSLSGGASMVSENEPFYVRDAADGSSLSLPSGATALSDEACVGLFSPTMRFFTRNTGSSSSTLRVDAVFTDAFGQNRSLLIATLSAGADWQPTQPVFILANVAALPMRTGGAAHVAFRFSAQGSGGDWQIEDVYIDPYKGT